MRRPESQFPSWTIPGPSAVRMLLTAVTGAATVAVVTAQPAVTGETAATNRVPVFRDVAADWGVEFQQSSAPDKKYIVESMSGGVALIDIDDDGLLDVYFVNSLTVDTAERPRSAESALFRNLGEGRFEKLSTEAGVSWPGWGVGVCVGDADGDGRDDLYVTGVEINRLYRNRGDRTFEEIAKEAGVAAGGWSAGCGFADYDRDGDLDLFVSRYVEIDLDDLPEFGKDKTCQYRGVAVQCGPRGLPGVSDLLFRNDGSGRFEDVSEAAGVADPHGYFGMGIAWFDADGDGWLDLYVANDASPNFLYVNQGDGTFREDAFPMGVAVSEDGAEQGGMGVAVGDLRNAGVLDLYVTNFAEEYNALYRNRQQYFSDVSFASGAAASSLPYVGWGTAFLDADNDGWLDLMVVNGHVYPQLERGRLGASAPYRQRRLFYLNRGGEELAEVGESMGEVFTEPRVSRGLAVGDLDRDGRLDVVINDLDGAGQVLHNQTPDVGNWLAVDLRQPGGNQRAIGAEVTATWRVPVRGSEEPRELSSLRVVRSGTSYLSQGSFRVHFGLGEAERVRRLEVRWPDGVVQTREDVAANQIFTWTRETRGAGSGAAAASEGSAQR